MKKLIYLSVLFGSIANAGWWVEPQLGYNSYTNKVVSTSSTDTSNKGAGLHMGVMGGYLINNMWAVGAGVQSDSNKSKYDNPANGADQDVAHTSFDAVFGFMQPKGFRAYANYAISTKTTVTPATGTSTDFTGGTKYGVGIGYQFHDHIAVNFDYVSYKPEKFTSSGIEFNVKDYFTTLENTAVGVNVSFPFNFGK